VSCLVRRASCLVRGHAALRLAPLREIRSSRGAFVRRTPKGVRYAGSRYDAGSRYLLCGSDRPRVAHVRAHVFQPPRAPSPLPRFSVFCSENRAHSGHDHNMLGRFSCHGVSPAHDDSAVELSALSVFSAVELSAFSACSAVELSAFSVFSAAELSAFSVFSVVELSAFSVSSAVELLRVLRALRGRTPGRSPHHVLPRRSEGSPPGRTTRAVTSSTNATASCSAAAP